MRDVLLGMEKEVLVDEILAHRKAIAGLTEDVNEQKIIVDQLKKSLQEKMAGNKILGLIYARQVLEEKLDKLEQQ